ncbi:multidrug ABC transporter ATP-binding protein [Rathayibacter rathayi]|uniref:Multidrug ABC transporter ATP-binding protein n=1 Tax=Rathayibacter rathayi TaxID=33887 RepID=A0ABD6W9D9_RATRA|nr:ATP-binding cassette domain-containing protein [Rathayibacter rathayi]AZZ48567.1 multidrug ABC transporter ATP-binding protein [Rathayibacter rathayi]MWV74880.1 ATP-binding cassette domain-containing protein [Rathayibacter rathayi NCPPB 2980 = VKM Ac-1601]PPF14709.1 multidrug ABC transporter ATP-binding protein [Rathayibacter rathayi]PPF24423.1 multidrug ABC transporter ATP-binding protein [Rathayibacter rathayi]PPF49938.1 multidrug ABC transporter ATP-binding protein [Rathayibacter rathayi
MTTGELAVETRGLTKRFGRQEAVSQLDLAVPRGAVFGFLGPNGSGKTTTIRMLLALAAPTEGSITLLGSAMPRRASDVLPRVGALVEGPAFYPFLSGAANLRRFDAAEAGTSPRTRNARAQEALARVGLSAAARKKVGSYSLGMKQRLGIAVALLSPRDLIVLDEPTNGLDPQGTREVRALVRGLNQDGTTVLVSSHLLAEIEQLCTHAAVMRTGRLVAQGGLDELRGDAAAVELLTPDRERALVTLRARGLEPRTAPGPHPADPPLVVAALPPGLAGETLVADLVQADVRVRGFAVRRPSLEERFVELTGEGFDVEH